MAASDKERRARACITFGAATADAIFEAKGRPPAVILTQHELAAICAVVSERVTEATLRAVTDAALNQVPGTGGVQ